MKPTSALRSFLAGTSLLAISYSHADQIWDGGSLVDSNWNTAANWGSDTLPTFTNAITFTGDVRNGAVNNLAADSIIGGMNLTNDGTAGKTNAFTLSGARITLGGNIVTTASSSAITDTISLAMILDGNRTITTNANHNLSISGVISQSGTRQLIKDGAGILTLSGTNTYSGGTTINAGIVRAGASTTVLGTGSLVFANVAGAAFELNGFNVSVNQLTGGGASGGNVVLSTGNTLTVSNIGGTYSGIISGGGNMTYGGSTGGTSTGAHTYTGITTLSSGNTAGIIVSSLANGGVASGIGASSSAAANLVFATSGNPAHHSTVRYNSASNASSDRGFTLQGNGGFGVYGGGSLNLTSTAAIAHGGNVAAKNLVLVGNGSGGGTMAAQITDSGTGVNITGVILGFANAANSGANWSLTNANNTFTGTITHTATTFAGGIFSYASAGGTNAITFNQTSGTGGVTYTGATDKTMSGAITANALTTGTITLGSSGAGAVNYSNTGSLGSAVSNTARNLILTGSNTGNNILAGQWVNNTGTTNAATLTKSGLGKWILTNNNTHTGATTISGGTLQLGNGTATGALSASSSISIASGATFAINQTDTVTQGTDFSSASITGAGNFTQAGAGTTVLNVTNGYTGATTVSGGTLIVNGNISTSVLTTVQTGATLGGTGTVGALAVLSGGFHTPGNSPGVQNTGNYSNAGTLGIEINSATLGTGYDQVNTTGTVSLSGLLSVTMGYTPAANELFFILANDLSDPITGTFSNAPLDGGTYTLGGQEFQISYFGNQTSPGVGTFTGGNDVVLMAIPEPSAALLGGLGLLALLRRRR